MLKRYLSAFISIILIFSLCSCSFNKNDKAVATVNGEEISVSIYRYFLSNLKSQIGDAQNVDGKPAAEYASEMAIDAAVKLYVTAQKAESLGVEFTDDMQKQVDDQIAALKSQPDYDKELEKYGLTEDDYALLVKYITVQNAVYEKITASYTPEQLNEFYNNDMVNIQHIQFKTVDENNVPLSKDVIADKHELAKEVLNRVKNGESFAELKTMYNEDTIDPEPVYMISEYSTQYDGPIVDASLKLEVDQVSDIVESRYGYHIIKRFNHVDNGEMFTSAQTDILSCLFEKDVELWTQASEVEYNNDAIKSVEY